MSPICDAEVFLIKANTTIEMIAAEAAGYLFLWLLCCISSLPWATTQSKKWVNVIPIQDTRAEGKHIVALPKSPDLKERLHPVLPGLVAWYQCLTEQLCKSFGPSEVSRYQNQQKSGAYTLSEIYLLFHHPINLFHGDIFCLFCFTSQLWSLITQWLWNPVNATYIKSG